MIAIAVFYRNHMTFSRKLALDETQGWGDIWDYMAKEANNSFDELVLVYLPDGGVETYTAQDYAQL